MIKHLLLGLFLIALPTIYSQSYVPIGSLDTVMKIKSAVSLRAYAFPLADVQLGESIFKDAMNANMAYLKALDPDRFLAQFRTNAGLEPKGEKYGGWENDGLAGHSLGHYLTACSLYYDSTKDPEFLERVNYIVAELALCQEKRGTGYVGAIPNEDQVFYKVALGEIQSRGFDLNGAWAPWYTIHKIMAGLMDAYIYCGNAKALKVEQGMADWTENVLRGLTYDEVQKMLRCEYGGMNEVLVNTYALTGDKKYLDLSYRFHDNFVMDSLSAQINPLPGKHSNTNIPKEIGTIRRYELTGDKKDSIAAKFLWESIVDHHTYAPGGNGNYEYFGPEDKLNNTLTDNTMETCATYNMLKLTNHLFVVQPKASYMDYYERALYNHILASQNREDGMSCYFMPLRMGTKKEFSDEFNTFTCCVGTTMENHVKYGEGIYNHGADGSLYVNLFIPSQLNWKERETKVVLQTQMPRTDHFSLTIQSKTKQEYTIRIRRPYWLKDQAVIKVNNRPLQKVEEDAAGYFLIKRKWGNQDKIDVTFPMGLHKMAMPDNKERATIFYGPLVLAGDLGSTEPDPGNGTPVFVTEAPLEQWIQMENKDKLIFKSVGAGEPKEVLFRPFYEFTNSYYSVYWDFFSPTAWEAQKKIYAEEKVRERKLADRTVDILRVGEMQPERDHEFEGENLRVGTDHTRTYRVADNGGYMTFKMKVDPERKNSIMLTYWGMDNRGRKFDILLGGDPIAQPDLNKYKDSKFYDIPYEIPLGLTQGKTTVTITLQALPNNQAGPIYGVRLIKERLEQQ